jgi:D-alanyl-lipoteichoic acid acyltransferase DltB (MBOAT superfamily)
MSLATFFAGQGVARARTSVLRRAWLALALLSCLGALGTAKYLDFFIANLAALLNLFGWHADLALLHLALPIGISFYTFQSLSYVIDVYRGQQAPCAKFGDFALFVAFFPTLLAGPITRAGQLLPQIEAAAPSSPAQVESGWALVLRGFVRKMAFADVLAAHLVDPAFSNPAAYSPLFLLVALYAYSLQIYMDVAGYTDIARGMARMIGFELPRNFERPYLSPSVSTFWQRWHITVSSFFRDYLFISLGGSRQGNVYANLMLTFVAIGLWHGAGWNFIVYGCIHGSVVCIERWRRTLRGGAAAAAIASPWGVAAHVALTFHIVALSRIFFRAPGLDEAIDYARAMAAFGGVGAAPFDLVGSTMLSLAVAAHLVPRGWSEGVLQRFMRWPVVVQACGLVVTVFALLALSINQSAFAYFHF